MIKAGIVGLGWWGSNLVRAAAKSEGEIEIVAGTVRHPENYAAFAAETGLALYDSFGEMLAGEQIDAVLIATPHSQHDAHIAQAVDAGKHIFCEKPLALTYAGAKAAYDLTTDKGLQLAVGFNRRHHPAVVETRRLVQAKKLGIPTQLVATLTLPNALGFTADNWRSNRAEWPVGSLTPLGVHVVDHIIDWFGEIDAVTACSVQRGATVDIDDTTAIMMRLKNGMLGTINTCVAAPVTGNISLFGTEAFIEISGHTYDRLTYAPAQGEAQVKEFSAYTVDGNALTDELIAFARAVEGGEEYPVTQAQVLHGCALVEAIIQSAESGAMVSVSN